MKSPFLAAALACFSLSLAPEAAAVVLAIDVTTTDNAALTQAGFQQFVFGGQGPVATVSQAFGAYTVTLAGVAGTTAATPNPAPGYGTASPNISARLRAQPVDSAGFTMGNMLRDFAFSNDANSGGMDITITGLAPNSVHTLELWSYDASSVGTRVSDWSANGTLIQENYTFSNTPAPTPSSDDFGKFTATVAANAAGTLLISGRRDEASRSGASNNVIDVGVFFNGLRLTAVPEPSAALLLLAGAALGARRRSRR